jgi:insertion element IS1 protein InsB
LPRRRPKKDQRREWEALELDEMWTFVGRRRRKVWLWLAVERASRRIVAWVVGRRDAATARSLWQALPGRYRRRCWYFTDLFPAYVGVLPRWHHRRCPKGTGGKSIIEAVNCSLRQRCGVLVRRSCSFSKKLAIHTARIKIVIDNYNLTLP